LAWDGAMASDRFPTGGGWRGALVGDRCEVFSSGLLPVATAAPYRRSAGC
jgi:hypothetical protein